jgi:hypothetical protein
MKKNRASPLLFFLACGLATAAAEEVPREFARLDLTDGRRLKNVVVKTYDPATDKVLLLADGKAMTVPRTLFPPPYASAFTALRRSGESVSSIPSPTRQMPAAADQYTMDRPVRVTRPAPPLATAPAKAPPGPATPNQALAQASGIDLRAHREAARARALRFYRSEFRVGSDSAYMAGVDLELGTPKLVPGWEGRCRAEGKAYLEIYDSRGGSFQRRTSTFEVITEKKVGDNDIQIVDFTAKS